MRRLGQTLLLLLLPLLGSGCVTHHLWTESHLDEWNQAAGDPHLRLFEDQSRHDLLVVYDEYSDRHETTRTRAYLLQQNEPQLGRHSRPRFVSVNCSQGLPAVPIFGTQPVIPPGRTYAVSATNSPSFTVFSGGGKAGTDHELPVYNDGVGRAERIALTPVTATMDATIIGGAVGVAWLYLLADSGFEWQP
jgi:hypothetical protein